MNEPDDVGAQHNSPADSDDSELGARLGALDEKIASRRGNEQQEREAGSSGNSGQGHGLALRLATELVAGTLVGGAIGWFFDGWLGTSPWGLIVFVMLGFVAGVLNALRSAGLVRESPAKLQASGVGDEAERGET